MIAFKHHERDCIYDEMNACIRFGKENIENVKKCELKKVNLYLM